MPAAPRQAWAGLGTAVPVTTWQYCRSLDESIAPVRNFDGPYGLGLGRNHAARAQAGSGDASSLEGERDAPVAFFQSLFGLG